MIEAFYSLGQERSGGEAGLRGGAGNDPITLDAAGFGLEEPHRVDGGEGGDTAVASRVEGPLEITLGESAGTLLVPQSVNRVGGLSEDHRITGLKLAEDRVEFHTDRFPGVTDAGVDVSAEAVDGQDALLVTFDGARSGTGRKTAILEGPSPGDADDIGLAPCGRSRPCWTPAGIGRSPLSRHRI